MKKRDKSDSLNKEEVAHYSRHLILEDVGMEGQLKLKNAKVLCVGTGGLGSPVLMYLAAAGVGHIGLVDFDVVDKSNLQRQILHGVSTIGSPKVLSAKGRLLDINPHIQIEVFEEALTSKNACVIVEPFDIIVDGTDNFPTRYLINDVCVLLGKPYVYGSIFKFDGQASVFNHKGCWVRPEGWDTLTKEERKELRKRNQDWLYNQLAKGPQYRDLYPEPPPPGSVPSCAEGGVLGVLPGIIGCIQANEVVKIILGIGRTLSGRMLSYDALSMSFREFKLQPNPTTPVITELIDYEEFCGFTSRKESQEGHVEPFIRLTAEDVSKRLSAGWDPIWIDVRKPHEIEIVALERVDYIKPHEDVLDLLSTLTDGRDVLIMCKLGGRSVKACRTLAEAGVSNLYNLDGGITAWARDVDPTLAIY